MSQKLSPAAILALKEALCSVYWYKNDLRTFLKLCLGDSQLLTLLEWDNYKRQIVSDLVDMMIRNPERFTGDLTKLCYEVCKISNFNHLNSLDDGEAKVKRAKGAIAELREMVDSHQDDEKEKNEIKKRQKIASEKLQRNQAVRAKLEEIRNRYLGLFGGTPPQARGYELEKIMYDIFELFDLDPKASFKNLGEQIDGAFSLEGTEYLFEAKWQKELCNKADLAVFSEKVKTKLENTLGVFLSVNGFSLEGVQAHQAGGAAIILLDGGDLMAVLDERIDFVSLLLRKKRHAAQTGNIYLPFLNIAQEPE